ncbi:MAG: indole-3-glycerol phosphate synthase TrpC [Saprospiraceae bacterium]|nr:indole-3-glycerol phosphate synthase TrpC [Saprospiraceae bacterium]
MNILDKIVLQKQKEVELAKAQYTISDLKKSVLYKRPCYSFAESILQNNRLGIIAEFKRMSPSKGLINIHNNEIKDVAAGYEKAQTSAMSVLTDQQFFGANDKDILLARAFTSLPLLRKEFIIDPYQVHEAKALGADAILLIAAILNKKTATKLFEEAQLLGLEVLFEIHDVSEIEIIPDDVKIIGINNRDLKYFKVDFERSMRMFDQLPNDKIKISESGLSDSKTVTELKRKGFDGFLIGENFMKTNNPGLSCAQFINECKALLDDN